MYLLSDIWGSAPALLLRFERSLTHQMDVCVNEPPRSCKVAGGFIRRSQRQSASSSDAVANRRPLQLMDSSAPFPTSDNSAVWPRRAVKVRRIRYLGCFGRSDDSLKQTGLRKLQVNTHDCAISAPLPNLLSSSDVIRYDVTETGEDW